MSQTIRHPEILDIARRDGKVTVEGLADHFGVTLQTIRRDLTDLALAGRLERVHGGAVLPSGVTNIGYEERRSLQAGAKSAIGRACAILVPEDCALFLNIGTTTEAVAAELLHHRGLMVMTNNLNVANILTRNPHCDVVVTGGTLRRADGGLIGPVTTEAIEQFKFDIAVIGCSALDADGDMLDFDISEVRVSRSVLARARRRILVADHSKLSRTAPVRIASLAEIAAVITDRPLPPDLATRCADWDTEIIVAGA